MAQKILRFGYSLVVVALLCFGQVSMAVTSVPLYSVKIPVTSQSSAVRNQALPNALQTVLIRVSGDAQVTRFPEIADMLKKPNQYVDEYSYKNSKDDATQPYILTVRFVSGAINDKLTQAGAVIWSKQRPLTLIWIAVKDAKGTQLIGSDSTEQAVQLVQQHADTRGLPLLFPMLDLTDLRGLSANDVWNFQTDAIKTASKRYFPDDILVIDVDESDPDNLSAKWLLLSQDQQQMRWETDGNALSDVVLAGIDNVADVLARRFAGVINSNQSGSVSITVMNLQGVSDYAKITKYLRGLSGVKQVSVGDVSSSQAEFDLTLSTDLRALQQTIRLDGVLQSVKEDGISVESDLNQPDLVYRYQSKEN